VLFRILKKEDLKKLYNLLAEANRIVGPAKKGEDKNGKARWEKVGVLMERDEGKKSVKIDLVPAGSWDGWLVVAERRPKDTSTEQHSAPLDEGEIPF